MKKIAILILLIISATGYLVYKKGFKKEEIKILETAKVSRTDINAVLVETGTIKSQVGAQVNISARATGVITQMNVKIGDSVKKGQLIALIDDREILENIEKSKSAYNYAEIFYRRQEKLLKTESTTQDAVDRAKRDYEQALSDLKQQEIRLSYTKIYSPIDGVVSNVTAQEGETIVSGLQAVDLVTVIDPTKLEMWIYVDETNIGKVKKGLKVEYTVDTYSDKIFSGDIHKIYPQPEIKDNIVYYLAIVQIKEEDTQWLKTGMTTRAKIIYESKQGIIAVPNEAVKFDEGKQVVYKAIGPGRIKKVVVDVGVRGEYLSEIKSGVKEGDTLATKLVLPVTFSAKQH